MPKFNSNFNPVAFSKFIHSLHSSKKNELIYSNILRRNSDIKNSFSSVGSTGFSILPMYANVDSDALNYDGVTDIVPSSTKPFERGVVVVGRANAWTEDDFLDDSSSGSTFMSNVAKHVSEYFSDVDQKTILSILKGIFNMSSSSKSSDKNSEFVSSHTLDISSTSEPTLGVTSINSAIQKACGDNKSKFSTIIMHSVVATNLENLNLINFLKFTDSSGIQRDLSLATLHGKMVLIDDSMTADLSDPSNPKYTTYILGKGSFDFEDIGSKVPFEISRDPKINGGQSTLYARTRKCFAPFGISYLKANQRTLSPTNEELSDGKNWSLVKEGESGKFIDHKLIPIARIISKG